jgi:hypothetical protein
MLISELDIINKLTEEIIPECLTKTGKILKDKFLKKSFLFLEEQKLGNLQEGEILVKLEEFVDKFNSRSLITEKESVAATQAKAKGWTSKFGGKWYDQQGNYVARTVNGQLIMAQPQEQEPQVKAPQETPIIPDVSEIPEEPNSSGLVTDALPQDPEEIIKAKKQQEDKKEKTTTSSYTHEGITITPDYGPLKPNKDNREKWSQLLEYDPLLENFASIRVIQNAFKPDPESGIESIFNTFKDVPKETAKKVSEAIQKLQDEGLIISISGDTNEEKFGQGQGLMSIKVSGVPIFTSPLMENEKRGIDVATGEPITKIDINVEQYQNTYGFTNEKGFTTDSPTFKVDPMLKKTNMKSDYVFQNADVPDRLKKLKFYNLGDSFSSCARNAAEAIDQTVKDPHWNRDNGVHRNERAAFENYSNVLKKIGDSKTPEDLTEELKSAFVKLQRQSPSRANEIVKNFGELHAAIMYSIQEPNRNKRIAFPDAGTAMFSDFVAYSQGADEQEFYVQEIPVKKKDEGARCSILGFYTSFMYKPEYKGYGEKMEKLLRMSDTRLEQQMGADEKYENYKFLTNVGGPFGTTYYDMFPDPVTKRDVEGNPIAYNLDKIGEFSKFMRERFTKDAGTAKQFLSLIKKTIDVEATKKRNQVLEVDKQGSIYQNDMNVNCIEDFLTTKAKKIDRSGNLTVNIVTKEDCERKRESALVFLRGKLLNDGAELSLADIQLLLEQFGNGS